MLKSDEWLGKTSELGQTARHDRAPARQMGGIEKKQIGLFGLFGAGNFGNDGSLEAMLLLLRRAAPGEPILCICEKPEEVRAAFGLNAIPLYRRFGKAVAGQRPGRVSRALGRATIWFYALWHLRRLKVLIVPGTGVLDDFAVSPFGWPHDILCWWLLARLMGVKVILASVGAGPIRHPVSRQLMTTAARAAHYRSYRDSVSKEFMDHIGLDTRNDPICPDIAFSLPAPEVVRGQRDDSAPLTVGLGVMAYHGWQGTRAGGEEIYNAYIEKMTTFARWLLDRGHEVRLLMGELSDRQAADDLLHAVRAHPSPPEAGCLTFAPAETLHDVMRHMADTDIVVATRYHNVVCALKMDKPTISVGYAKKNDALLSEMDLADFCQPIEGLDVNLLKRQTLRLLSERTFFEQRIAEVRRRFERQLKKQGEALSTMLHSDRPLASKRSIS